MILIIISIVYRIIVSAAILSLFLIGATFIFGRFFCGFVCPLGTTIDIFDSIIGIVPATNSGGLPSATTIKNIKYLILLFLIVSAIIGCSFLHFFDPFIIFERSITLIFYPIITYFISFFTTLKNTVYIENIIAFIAFSAIIGFGFLAPRFWCRNLCPLGGILAFFAKFSILKFTILEGCKKCSICEKICLTGAINSKELKIDSAECIDCFRCLYECPHKTLQYQINFQTMPFDVRRRELITTFGAALIAVPLARSLIHKRINGRLIRPPGSIPEEDFLNVCIHCGKCMKVCPTNGLQPCLLEAGINGLWTPRLVARIGGCEQNCNSCGNICPTSAIRKLPLDEKTYVKMGVAVIDRTRCIAWEENKVCLICDEACPYNAISSLNETIHGITLLRPFVDEGICTGCGICEYRCLLEGDSAILIFSIGEERKARGSYITEEKVRLRGCEEKKEDIPSGFIIE